MTNASERNINDYCCDRCYISQHKRLPIIKKHQPFCWKKEADIWGNSVENLPALWWLGNSNQFWHWDEEERWEMNAMESNLNQFRYQKNKEFKACRSCKVIEYFTSCHR